MTTKYQMTQAEETLGRILDNVATKLSEPAHDLLSEARGATYAAWLEPGSQRISRIREGPTEPHDALFVSVHRNVEPWAMSKLIIPAPPSVKHPAPGADPTDTC